MTHLKTLIVMLLLMAPTARGAMAARPVFQDEFTQSSTERWTPYMDSGTLTAADGHVVAEAPRDAAWLAGTPPADEMIAQADFRVSHSGRINFGIVLGAGEDRTCLMVRHYDHIDGLQFLRFENGRVTRTENGSSRVSVLPGRWYRMKVVALKDELLARLWPVEASEPDWQLNVKQDRAAAGKIGITVQESTIDVDNVRIWSGAAVEQWKANRERLEAERRQRKIDAMTLEVTPTPHLMWTPDGPERRIEMSAVADGAIEEVGGTVVIHAGDKSHRFEVEPHWFLQGPAPFYVPEAREPTRVRATFETDYGKTLAGEAALDPVPDRVKALTAPDRTPERAYRRYVQNCIDTLITRGTDRYGPAHTPMLMAVIDVNTLTAPENPPLLDSFYRTEGRPDHGRRSPGGSNLWLDQPLLKVMYRLTEVTGDTRYAEAADDYIRATFKHAVKTSAERSGLLYWGSHSYYHAYRDSHGGDGAHEILILHPDWEAMYRVDPEGVTREIEQIWNHHIRNKATGLHNRHDSEGSGDFAFSGGSFCIAFCFLYEKTGDSTWLERAVLLADYHFAARDPETRLAPTAPESAQCAACFNGHFCNTQLTGPFASQMLRCYEMTRVPRFREIAETFIKAYDRYGWDNAARSYFGALRMDGTPLKNKSEWNDYVWAPDGYVEIWRTIMYSWEFPLISAQTSVWAYELSGRERPSRDPELLDIARRWGMVIERSLPPQLGHRWRAQVTEAMPRAYEVQGAYAENYGRAISVFVGLHHATGEMWYLNRARQLANEAIDKLYVNGLFRGHPAKDYYETCDGVGVLLHALLQLDALPDRWRPAF